jgi:hypothetical protein
MRAAIDSRRAVDTFVAEPWMIPLSVVRQYIRHTDFALQLS